MTFFAYTGTGSPFSCEFPFGCGRRVIIQLVQGMKLVSAGVVFVMGAGKVPRFSRRILKPPVSF
jgi:hypothetical protein